MSGDNVNGGLEAEGIKGQKRPFNFIQCIGSILFNVLP